jgi:solute carrier family 13 (sodium-dependent dicarboxylate transporter), member 2/3/5
MLFDKSEKGSRKLWCFLLALLAGVVTLMVAPYTGLLPPGQKLLATLVFIIFVWATEALSYPVSALLLIVLMTGAIFDGKVTMKAAFLQSLAGFSGTVPITVIAGTAFAAVVKACGLSERIVYFMMRLVAGSKKNASAQRVLGAMLMADIPTAFLVPSAMGRNALYISIAEGLKQTFQFAKLEGSEKGNPFQKAVWIAAAVAPVIMGAAFLTGAEATIMAGRLIEDGTGIPQYWGNTFVMLFVPAVLMMLATWAILLKLFPSDVKEVPTDFINNKLKEMGPISYYEKYVISTVFIAVLLWMTDNIHHIPAEIILVLVAMAMFIPKIAPGDWKRDQKHIAWGGYLVIAVSTGFASLLAKYGIVEMIAGWLAATGVSGFVSIMLLMVFATVMIRFGIASITAAATLFIPLAIALGKVSGLEPAMLVGLGWVTYVFCRAGFIMPQQTAQLIIVYDYNYFSRIDLMKAGSLMTLAALLIYGLWAAFVMPILM